MGRTPEPKTDVQWARALSRDASRDMLLDWSMLIAHSVSSSTVGCGKVGDEWDGEGEGEERRMMTVLISVGEEEEGGGPAISTPPPSPGSR